VPDRPCAALANLNAGGDVLEVEDARLKADGLSEGRSRVPACDELASFSRPPTSLNPGAVTVRWYRRPRW
jgi:hypothetical protein